MASEQKNIEWKVSDRVKRIPDIAGEESFSIGTVKEVREESTGTADKDGKKPFLICVQWDNGTASVTGPGGLEREGK